jgi:hypothetical protein
MDKKHPAEPAKKKGDLPPREAAEEERKVAEREAKREGGSPTPDKTGPLED